MLFECARTVKTWKKWNCDSSVVCSRYVEQEQPKNCKGSQEICLPASEAGVQRHGTISYPTGTRTRRGQVAGFGE